MCWDRDESLSPLWTWPGALISSLTQTPVGTHPASGTIVEQNCGESLPCAQLQYAGLTGSVLCLREHQCLGGPEPLCPEVGESLWETPLGAESGV